MSDSQINIIINTMKAGFGDKDAKSALKELSSGFQSVTGLSLTYAGALTAAVAVGKKFIDFTKEAIDYEVQQGQEISKLTSMTGDLADMDSRLLVLANDQQLSYDSLNAAMQAATKKGIDPSVESLEKLSDQYLALAPGMERANFLEDTFGKSGSEMYKIMELGSAGIKDKMAAVSDSNVMDEKAITDTLAYQKSLVNLNDAVNGLKISLAKYVTPTVSDFDTVLGYLINQVNSSSGTQFLKWFLDLEGIMSGFGPVMALWNGITSLFHESAEAIDGNTGEMTRAEGMNERATKQMEAMGYTLDATTGQWVKNSNAASEDADAMAKSIKAASDWEVKYTGLKTVQDQIDLGWDALTTGLEDMGVKGNEAANVLLEGLGKIAPAAAEAYAETQKILGDLNSAISEGYSPAMVAYIAKTEQDSYNNATNPTTSTATSGTTGNQYDSSGKIIPHNNGVNGYYDNAGTWHYTKMAQGGRFGAGQAMMVGEKGPEKVVFNQGGTVIPNGAGGGGNIYISVSGAGDPKTVAKEVINQLKLQGVGRGQ